MAAPNRTKDFLNMELCLPHMYWGLTDAKRYYPNDWKKGHQLVVLKTQHPATETTVESLEFTSDNDENYMITLQDLKQYWKEKRFKCKHNQSPSLFCYQFDLK